MLDPQDTAHLTDPAVRAALRATADALYAELDREKAAARRGSG